MRIRASAAARNKALHQDDGVGRLTLTADKDEGRDRQFMTSVYRIIWGNPDREEQMRGVEWMREYLKSFPPFGSVIVPNVPYEFHAEYIVLSANAFPEMLAALESALAMFKGSDREHALVGDPADQITISDVLRTAIAAAKSASSDEGSQATHSATGDVSA